MADSPVRKKGHKVCTCWSHDCRDQTWEDEDGELRRGRWVHRNTVKKHGDEDAERRNAQGFPSQASSDPAASDSAAALPAVSPIAPLPPKEIIVGEEDTPQQAYRRLSFIVCTFAAWLHLVCGLSRDASHRVLKFICVILEMVAMNSTSSQSHAIPADIRTAMKRLSIEPVIDRAICCPKCFRQYSLKELPQTCFYRETSASKPCSTPLWVERQTRSGPKIVPRRLYSTQNLESWLSHFLSRPGMEDLLRKSHQHVPNPNRMSSIWDSPAWQSLGTFTTTPNNLVFSYYIDWFNPFTNKIAGKSVSCGAIMACCLNLPYELQRLSDNTFFVGLTPPPHEPTVTTITAVSDPVMDQFQAMWDGKMIRTHDHPNGDFYRVAIIPAIGDILALKKAMGCAGHRSKNHFCSFCKLKLSEIDRVDHHNFERRSGVEVLRWSKAWLLASTKKARKSIVQQHGSRWSSLNKLTYRDPVKHTVLGIMHNWMEGVLQHHARLKWGIGIEASTAAAGSTLGIEEEEDRSESGSDEAAADMWDDVEMMAIDEDLLQAELADLHWDSVAQQDTPSHLKRQPSIIFREEDTDSVEPALDSDDEDEDSDYVDDEEIYATEKPRCQIFDDEAMSKIRAGLAGVVIPSWIERPPVNLGEKAHGKLKADNWLVLFTIFFPLIIPELFHHPSSSPTDRKLLDNFDDLVTATNILCSYAISPQDPDLYLASYVRYLESSKVLFPGLTTRPNHHYAFHGGEQMKWWGPLIKVAEFMYESHNGRLQKIKTNNHMWELDFTMLWQICRRGRLLASIRDGANMANSLVARALRILLPQQTFEADGSGPKPLMSRAEEVAHNGSGILLDPMIHELIFQHWNQTFSPPYIRATEVTYQDLDSDIPVFPTRAVHADHLKHKTHTFSTFSKHHGNSSISFYNPLIGRKDAGYILSMWMLALQGQIHTFIIVQPHTALRSQDDKKTPYDARPGLACFVGYTNPSQPKRPIIVETRHLISHLSYYRRPPGTFGVREPTTIFVDSLQRNRD